MNLKVCLRPRVHDFSSLQAFSDTVFNPVDRLHCILLLKNHDFSLLSPFLSVLDGLEPLLGLHVLAPQLGGAQAGPGGKQEQEQTLSKDLQRGKNYKKLNLKIFKRKNQK